MYFLLLDSDTLVRGADYKLTKKIAVGCRCEKCGNQFPTDQLTIHHIAPQEKKTKKLPLQFHRTQVLCTRCHKDVHDPNSSTSSLLLDSNRAEDVASVLLAQCKKLRNTLQHLGTVQQNSIRVQTVRAAIANLEGTVDSCLRS